MKILAIALAVLAATLTLATPSFSEEERRIKLLLANNPEAGLVEIETSELALGETRSFSSENGHPVLLTRTENGLEIELDGKTTVIDMPPAQGEGFELQTFTDENPGADGKPRQRVIVKRRSGGQAESGGDGQFVFHGKLDGANVAIHGEPGADGKEVRIVRIDAAGHGEPGEAKKVHVVMKDGADLAGARAKLIASGALEGLDAATRARILAALDGEQK